MSWVLDKLSKVSPFRRWFRAGPLQPVPRYGLHGKSAGFPSQRPYRTVLQHLDLDLHHVGALRTPWGAAPAWRWNFRRSDAWSR